MVCSRSDRSDMKRHTKFGYGDVNEYGEDGSSCSQDNDSGTPEVQISGGEPAAANANALGTTRSTFAAVKLARFRRL